MPCCDDEELSPSEFYCHGETNDPNATFQGENNAEQNNSNESAFCFFSTKSEQTAIQQSHIINPLLTSFARSVRETSGNTFPYRPRTRLISP